MANATQRKKGLTTFGWLLVGGAGGVAGGRTKNPTPDAGVVNDKGGKVKAAGGSPKTTV